MLEYHYIHKPIHLINVQTVNHKPSGMVATELLEVALINTETGGVIDTKDIIEKLLNSDDKIKKYNSDDFSLYLKHTSKYIGDTAFGWFTRIFRTKQVEDIKIENEYHLIIHNPLWVPILIKSIAVETPRFPEIGPNFKNIWTVPLNDLSEVIVKHLYKRIVDKNCLNNDMILIQEIDWKIGKLTDLKK